MFDGDLSKVWPGWELGKRIGEGSYGVVHECIKRENSVTYRSAVKIITISRDAMNFDFLSSEGYTQEDARAYLQSAVDGCIREIKIMVELKGMKNIVNIEDYKVLEDPEKLEWVIFIRMELLTSLSKFQVDRELTEQELIKLGVDVCSALELFETKGIIHRDIKEGNILVNDYGDYKIGDFGIARTLEQLSSEMSIKGNYACMAPEVEKGENYDSTADQYSLGLILYKLTNKKRLPFMNTEKQILSFMERTEAIKRRMSGEALPPPCEASPEFAEIILKACDPNPKKRFATAKQMKEALLRLDAMVDDLAPEEDRRGGIIILSCIGITCLLFLLTCIYFFTKQLQLEEKMAQGTNFSTASSGVGNSGGNGTMPSPGNTPSGNGSLVASAIVSSTSMSSTSPNPSSSVESSTEDPTQESKEVPETVESGDTNQTESQETMPTETASQETSSVENTSRETASMEKTPAPSWPTVESSVESSVVVAPYLTDLIINHGGDYYYGDPVVDDRFSARAIYSDGTIKALNPSEYYVTGSTRDSRDQVTFYLYYQSLSKAFTARIKFPEARIDYDSTTNKCTCSIYPVRSTNQIWEWKSSNTKAVTIDQNGYLKAVTGDKEATITCNYLFNGDLYSATGTVQTSFDAWGAWSGYTFDTKTTSATRQEEQATLYQYYYFYDNNGTHSPLWNISYGANVIEENTYTVVYAPLGYENCSGQWWDGQYFEALSYSGQGIRSNKNGGWDSVDLKDQMMFAHESRGTITAYRYRERGFHIGKFENE